MDICLDINCNISGSKSASNIKREVKVVSSCSYSGAHKVLNFGCLSHWVKHMYRPACYTFYPMSPGMVLLWEGFYQRELIANASLACWGVSSAISEAKPPWYSYMYLRKDRCCRSPLLHHCPFCCFICWTLNMTFWPELALECMGHPAIGKGMKKDEVSPFYKCGRLVIHRIHCVNSFLCLQLLFRASGRFLSLLFHIHCFIYTHWISLFDSFELKCG